MELPHATLLLFIPIYLCVCFAAVRLRAHFHQMERYEVA